MCFESLQEGSAWFIRRRGEAIYKIGWIERKVFPRARIKAA
jgi:L-asparaginase II